MRIGRIGYINCAPVYGAIDRGIVALPPGGELVTGTPAELNDLLVAGELDVSVISAIEYARHAKELVLLSDLAISCDGPVRSVALFSKRPVTALPVDSCREYLSGLDYAFTDTHRAALGDFLRRVGVPQFLQVA